MNEQKLSGKDAVHGRVKHSEEPRFCDHSHLNLLNCHTIRICPDPTSDFFVVPPRDWNGPMTDQVGKRTSDWTPECQKAFDTIKALLAKDAFIEHPDHNRPFHIHCCDACDLQSGAVIMQDNAPVARCCRKLDSAQNNCAVGEKELLSIVKSLKEHRSMLFECKELHVCADHKNITFS
jgi:hypothetical protein